MNKHKKPVIIKLSVTSPVPTDKGLKDSRSPYDEVLFPDVCCRCSIDNPSETFKVMPQSNSGSLAENLSGFRGFLVPICKNCYDIVNTKSRRMFTIIVTVFGVCLAIAGILYIIFGKDSHVFQYGALISIIMAFAVYSRLKKRYDEPDPVNAWYNSILPLTLIFNFYNSEYARHFLKANRKVKEN